MESEVWQLTGSVAAILLIIGLIHSLGLSKLTATLSETDVEEYVRLAPGGSPPRRIVVDDAGECALAEVQGERVFLVRRHGAAYLAVPLSCEDEAVRTDTALTITSGGTGTALQLGEQVQLWERIVRASIAR